MLKVLSREPAFHRPPSGCSLRAPFYGEERDFVSAEVVDTNVSGVVDKTAFGFCLQFAFRCCLFS